MRNGKCPKCNLQEIYYSKEQGLIVTGGKPSYLNVFVFKENGWNSENEYLNLEHYLCRACGYVESYASTTDPMFAKLETATNWKKL